MAKKVRKPKKPKEFTIDGRRFGDLAYLRCGARICSVYLTLKELRRLRDWLNRAIEWMEQQD